MRAFGVQARKTQAQRWHGLVISVGQVITSPKELRHVETPQVHETFLPFALLQLTGITDAPHIEQPSHVVVGHPAGAQL